MFDFISAEDDDVIMISLPTLISSEFYDNFSSRSFLNFLRKGEKNVKYFRVGIHTFVILTQRRPNKGIHSHLGDNNYVLRKNVFQIFNT